MQRHFLYFFRQECLYRYRSKQFFLRRQDLVQQRQWYAWQTTTTTEFYREYRSNPCARRVAVSWRSCWGLEASGGPGLWRLLGALVGGAPLSCLCYCLWPRRSYPCLCCCLWPRRSYPCLFCLLSVSYALLPLPVLLAVCAAF